ncbi:GntR family transcriptional regulator [Pseudogracilibacillus auburnensis]|uniref:GntR family transcriptional regulator n=1 Tax=Pseudogracilibacillus auburnensis TaxID=1494959 RepID=A0A2V3VNU5_9BACI|nr:GntR family transcriptional regulator [Pseudogracilibacillus auburnensis]MBO1002727.1 GntR family transcriptional regulator [Pseudogracilibacillus auburnensis]PXW81695.1 GntR family transcriptional regulator [Pseudogracilibacillus auburnensis]
MKKIKQSETLADQAYKMLKQAITNGKLKDKEQLPEEKLAKNLGISRTPLRDALGRLAAEGLIIHQTGRPAVVASFTKENSLEYMELRSLLEVYNIEKIISKVDTPFINLLKNNAAEQLDAIERDNYNDFIELDREFHLLLASRNNNSELRKIIHRMNTGINRAFLILSKTVPKSAKEAYYEHLDIIEAIEKQDVVLARSKMIVHMNNVEKRFLSYYAEES